VDADSMPGGIEEFLYFNCAHVFVSMIPPLQWKMRNADETLFTLSRQYVLDPFAAHVGNVEGELG
jgi:hypothetical protein